MVSEGQHRLSPVRIILDGFASLTGIWADAPGAFHQKVDWLVAISTGTRLFAQDSKLAPSLKLQFSGCKNSHNLLCCKAPLAIHLPQATNSTRDSPL
jgi:hypothetical protein